MTRIAISLLFPLLLLLAGPAQAQSLVSDLREPDFAKAWDMVFVAEGYRAGEEALFLADARALGRKLRRGSTAKPIRDAYTFNLHYLFVPSTERVSWRPDGSAGQTAARSYVDADGVLVTDDARVDVLALTHAPDVDSIVILAKLDGPDAIDPASLGALADVVAHPDHVRANADMPYDGRRTRLPTIDGEAFLHELGHALFGLGDEYEEYPGAIPPGSRWEVALTPNLSVHESNARWAHVVDTVFEGGGYYERGVFRGEESCRMRESRQGSFCEVCKAAMGEVPDAGVPPAPRLVAPTKGALLAPGKNVRARWRAAEDPIYFAVEVYRTDEEGDEQGAAVWEDYVEGHRRSVTLVIPPGVGDYEVRVFAVNVAGESSDGSIRTFRRTQAASADRSGIIDRLQPPQSSTKDSPGQR